MVIDLIILNLKLKNLGYNLFSIGLVVFYLKKYYTVNFSINQKVVIFKLMNFKKIKNILFCGILNLLLTAFSGL